jgi:hypothetical protein
VHFSPNDLKARGTQEATRFASSDPRALNETFIRRIEVLQVGSVAAVSRRVAPLLVRVAH